MAKRKNIYIVLVGLICSALIVLCSVKHINKKIDNEVVETATLLATTISDTSDDLTLLVLMPSMSEVSTSIS